MKIMPEAMHAGHRNSQPYGCGAKNSIVTQNTLPAGITIATVNNSSFVQKEYHKIMLFAN